MFTFVKFGKNSLISPELENHLSAMHSARRAFVKAESSEKIKRAIRHPVRSCKQMFQNGDKVFYKREDNPQWRGPGKVLGHLGYVYLYMLFTVHVSSDVLHVVS